MNTVGPFANAGDRTPVQFAMPVSGAPGARKAVAKPTGGRVVLLSGGNPRSAKADGDAPVQAYIAAGKDEDSRWVDIYENGLDEAQMATWIRQAASLPGWDLT